VAKFTFGKAVDIHWNGYEIVGPALTEFSIPDQLYEEFEGDFREIEPSLTWTDTNEFATLSASVSGSTLSATAPIALTSTSTGRIISFSSGTSPNGYLLSAESSVRLQSRQAGQPPLRSPLTKPRLLGLPPPPTHRSSASSSRTQLAPRSRRALRCMCLVRLATMR